MKIRYKGWGTNNTWYFCSAHSDKQALKLLRDQMKAKVGWFKITELFKYDDTIEQYKKIELKENTHLSFRKILKEIIEENSCSDCDYFEESIKKCLIEKKVLVQHGEQSLNKWVYNPNKMNDCSLFEEE